MGATTSPPGIVVIDDNALLAELTQEYLTNLGYAVARGPRGDEAFAFIRAHQPDLIILVVPLLGVGVFDVLHRLSTDPQMASIPVCVLLCTGVSSGERQAWDKVLARMGVPVLFAPFAPADLAATVRALLPTDGTRGAPRP